MHTTKRAVLLSCSDHYNHRLYVIDGYLKSQGYETVYYTGDFDHSSKKFCSPSSSYSILST